MQKVKTFKICIVVVLLLTLVPVLLGAFIVGEQGGNENAELEKKGTPLVILMYHEVSNRKQTDYILALDKLESDLQFLKDNGYTSIFIQDLIDYQEKGTPLPLKPVMITFDDGGRTDFTNAFPLLKKYNTKAVISVVGRYTDRAYNEKGEIGGVYTNSLTYEHMREMIDSGLVEIQNHTYDLHSLTCRKGLKDKKGECASEYEKMLTADLTRLDDRLQEKLGFRPTAVAFPYGAYSKNTISIIKKMGYKASLTCNEGINYITRDSNLFLLKRYNRCPNRSAEKLLA